MTAADPQTWENTLHQQGEVTLAQSRGKTVLLLGAAVVFTAVGISLIFADSPAIGWLSVLFFGVLGIPVLGYMTLRPQTVSVTAEHISPQGKFQMPWNEVLEVFRFSTTNNTHTVALRLTSEGIERVRNSSSKLQQASTDALTPLANQYVEDDVVEVYTLPPALGGSQVDVVRWLESIRQQATAD